VIYVYVVCCLCMVCVRVGVVVRFLRRFGWFSSVGWVSLVCFCVWCFRFVVVCVFCVRLCVFVILLFGVCLLIWLAGLMV
jgi:hypothetical protein